MQINTRFHYVLLNRLLIINLSLLLLFIGVNTNAQKIDTRTITIHGKDTLIEASIVVKRNIDIKLKGNAEYHWYAFDKIRMNQGAYSGHLLHGTYKKYIGDHSLVEKGMYNLGIKTGVWKEWDMDGKTKAEYRLKEGLKDGIFKFYHDGKLIREENYNKGILNGKSTIYENDTTITLKYNNGDLIAPKEKTPKESKTSLINKLRNIFKKKAIRAENPNTEIPIEDKRQKRKEKKTKEKGITESKVKENKEI